MGDEYRQIRLLGQGAFGKCYLVEKKKDNSNWVLKQIDIHSMSEAEKKEALKEAKILKAFDHPNIIRCTDAYTTKNGKLCIVMEYADGGDLQKKIKDQRGKLFQEVQILDWLVQLCLSLKHVHDRKILHRDIKSQNVFLTKDDIVKMGDFGIAKVLGNTRENARTMVGTPYYLSPEIVENKPYNFKSDVWSLGVLFYELCTLKPPFDASSLHFLALKIVRGVYPPLPPHYSRDLKTLVKQMLSIDPAKRPTVTQILKMPFIKNRIQKFLSETIISDEFSHTVFHHENPLDKKKQDKPLPIPPPSNQFPIKKPTPKEILPTPKDYKDKPREILPTPKDYKDKPREIRPTPKEYRPENRQEQRPVPGVPSSVIDKKPIQKPMPILDYKALEHPPIYNPKPIAPPKPTPSNLEYNLPKPVPYPSAPVYPPSNYHEYNMPKPYPKPPIYNEPHILLSDLVKPSSKAQDKNIQDVKPDIKWGRLSQDLPKKDIIKPVPKPKRKNVEVVKLAPKAVDKKKEILLKKKIEEAKIKREINEQKLEEVKLGKAKERDEREQQRNLERLKMFKDIKNKKKAAKNRPPVVEWLGQPKYASVEDSISTARTVEPPEKHERYISQPEINTFIEVVKSEPQRQPEVRTKLPKFSEDKLKENVVVEKNDGFVIYYSKGQIEKARMIEELRNQVEQDDDSSVEPYNYSIIQEVTDEDLDREDMIENTPTLPSEETSSTASTEPYTEPLQPTPIAQNAPVHSEESSGFSKLELLRWYLEEKLGANALVSAYHVLKRYADSEDENWTYEDAYPELSGVIQEKKIKEYTPLIHTLIIMEEYAEGNR